MVGYVCRAQRPLAPPLLCLPGAQLQWGLCVSVLWFVVAAHKKRPRALAAVLSAYLPVCVFLCPPVVHCTVPHPYIPTLLCVEGVRVPALLHSKDSPSAPSTYAHTQPLLPHTHTHALVAAVPAAASFPTSVAPSTPQLYTTPHCLLLLVVTCCCCCCYHAQAVYSY